MQNASLFMPDTIENALRADLPAGLRALADALEAGELDAKFISSTAAAGGRHDDRIHLRIVIGIAAPTIEQLAPGTPRGALKSKEEDKLRSEPLELTPDDPEVKEQDLADYDCGFQAAMDGAPRDPLNETLAWQKGWADANE